LENNINKFSYLTPSFNLVYRKLSDLPQKSCTLPPCLHFVVARGAFSTSTALVS